MCIRDRPKPVATMAMEITRKRRARESGAMGMLWSNRLMNQLVIKLTTICSISRIPKFFRSSTHCIKIQNT